MQSVQTNYITLILLRILGFAGNVALWKKLETTHLNLIGMTNTLSQIIKVLLKFTKLKISLILATCKRYDIKELNNLLKTPNESNEPLSIMFKNIDGVISNFDLFSAEINSIFDKIPIITFAETNLDECNKNLF